MRADLSSADRTVTWAAAAGFAAVVALELVVILTPPAPAYEFSIYAAYPWFFWAIAAGTLFLGQAVVLRAAFDTDDGPSRWWLGLVLVLLVEALLLLMPYFRGYPVYGRGDALTHVGFVRSIHASGMVGPQNIYPNIHLAVLAFSYATGVEPMHVINGFTVVVSLFFVVAAYGLVTAAYDRRRALFTLPFVTLPIAGFGHLIAAPFAMSTLMVPFVLYLFVKERETRAISVRLALVIGLVGLVLYHPITTLFLLFVLGLFRVAQTLVARGRLGPAERAPPVGGSATALNLTLAVFVSWYYHFTSVIHRFRTVVTRLLFPAPEESTLETYSSILVRTTPALPDLFRLTLVKYGRGAILLGFGGLYVLGMARRRTRSRFEPSVYRLTFAGAFAVFAFFWGVFFVVDLIIGPGRLLSFAELFGAFLAGSLFYGLDRTPGWRRLGRTTLVLAVAALAVLSVFSLYHSPYDGRINQQTTSAELDGSAWLLGHRDADHELLEFGGDVDRFRDALHGVRGWDEELLVADSTTHAPPDHFAYRDRPTLGGGYASDRYLVVTRAGRGFYPALYPTYRAFWRFSQVDFTRLQGDPTVTQVYDNGGFDAYLVRGTNATPPGNASQAADDSDRPIP